MVYTHICEICAKPFNNKLYYDLHKKLTHSTTEIPKVQCQICGLWVKHEYRLKIHMKNHEENDEPDNKEYFCNYCGIKKNTKKALVSHVGYIHLSERKFKCNVCEKAFKREIELKEHMATHTGDVLYNCEYCTKTFNSKANMYAHTKRSHSVEWAEKRKIPLPNNIEINS